MARLGPEAGRTQRQRSPAKDFSREPIQRLSADGWTSVILAHAAYPFLPMIVVSIVLECTIHSLQHVLNLQRR